MAGGEVALVCPRCQQDRPRWTEALDRCPACRSTRLGLVLGSLVCRACGHTTGEAGFAPEE